MISAPTYKVKNWLLKGISVGKYSIVVYSMNKADARERETERERESKEGRTNKQTQKKQTTKIVRKERRTSAGKYEKQTQKRGRKREQHIRLNK